MEGLLSQFKLLNRGQYHFLFILCCDFLLECYMAPTAIRERRRTLRYRNLLVRQMVQMKIKIKIKISTLLMEATHRRDG
jgi:hypothetical protein